MGASKTITSPDPSGGDVLTHRGEGLAFIETVHLDALELLYRSGYSKDVVRLIGEKCGVDDADVTARLTEVDAEASPEASAPSVRSPRGQ